MAPADVEEGFLGLDKFSNQGAFPTHADIGFIRRSNEEYSVVAWQRIFASGRGHRGEIAENQKRIQAHRNAVEHATIESCGVDATKYSDLKTKLEDYRDGMAAHKAGPKNPVQTATARIGSWSVSNGRGGEIVADGQRSTRPIQFTFEEIRLWQTVAVHFAGVSAYWSQAMLRNKRVATAAQIRRSRVKVAGDAIYVELDPIEGTVSFV